MRSSQTSSFPKSCFCRARVAPARGAGARSPRSALIFHTFMGARADGLLLSPQGYTHRRTRADAARHDRVQLLPSRCRRRHAAAAAVEPASETADTAETADAAETATTGATAADVSRHISPYLAISRHLLSMSAISRHISPSNAASDASAATAAFLPPLPPPSPCVTTACDDCV